MTVENVNVEASIQTAKELIAKQEFKDNPPRFSQLTCNINTLHPLHM
jgi:hypothetical protein